MKKLLLTTTAFALLSAGVMAQNAIKAGVPEKNNFKGQQNERTDFSTPDLKSGQKLNRGCATPVPSKEWDEAFNKIVEQHKADLAASRTTATTYTIPIIFHIIHEGEAEGVGHNVSQAQVNSQIPILNADYNGTGYNTSLYSAMTYSGQPAFYQYAHAYTSGSYSLNPSSLASNGSIAIANCGIYFCLATKNPSGTTLTEPGIDRQPYTVGGNTTKPSASSNVQTLFDGTIKPATIWDPTKYFNVWVSDGGTSGLLGYATFPPAALTGSGSVSSNENAGTTTGSFGMTVSSVTTTDGVWMSYQGLGNTGTAASPYQYGRTLTHESGHYFGLRHIWGDGSCLNDYCNDTPPAAAANYVNCGTAYPYHSGTCTSAPSNSPNGEMYMDFMDYSDDCGLWMFTNEQKARMLASIASSPYRSGPAANSVNICAGVTVSTPTAAFTPPSSVCASVSTTFTDGSSGPPTSWAWSVSPSTGVTFTSNTVANPGITFPAAGTYTVTDAVTNSAGSNSVSHVVTVTSCTTSVCDTATHIGSTDTLLLYKASTGYFFGNNNYAFTGLAESFATTDFPTGSMQVKGAIICFYRKSTTIGTHGVSTHTATTLSMVNSSTSPAGTAAATKAITYANIAATTAVQAVDFAGTPGLGYSTSIIVPYVATFATPVPLSSNFFMSLSVAAVTGDTLALFSGGGGHNATNTAWVDYSSTWSAFSSLGTPNYALAIFPIACPVTTTGIESNQLGTNINLFPNPNSGQFNFAISLPESTNLNFTIVNMLGQVVYTKAENNVTNTVLSVDLSNLAKGIYYANITDSNNNKTVKKIIIQ